MRIPKIINFIWAGGDNPMPPEYIDTVIAWKNANPNFEVCVWLDQTSCSSATSWELLQMSHARLRDAGIVFKDIEAPPRRIKPGLLAFFCRRTEPVEITDEYIRYELDRLRSNYGASSDLLRYKILYEYGGAYFDSDVIPGPRPLATDPLFTTDHTTHFCGCLNAAENSHRLSLHANSQGRKGMVGNDGLICTPKNPYLKEIFECAKANYTLTSGKIEDERSAFMIPRNAPNYLPYYYDDFDYIETTTQFKTGPLCIRSVSQHYSQDASISEMGDLAVAAEKNGRYWIGTALNRKLTLEKCLKSISGTVKFEQDKLHLLRLDDHVSNLMEILGISAEEAFTHLKPILAQVDFTNITSIQLTFKHDETIELCESKNILAKTFLFPGDKFCRTAMVIDDYYKIPIEAITLERKYNDLSSFIGWESNTAKTSNEKCADFSVEIAQLSASTVKFYEFIIAHFEEHALDQTYLRFLLKNLKSSMDKYKELLFPDEYKNEAREPVDLIEAIKFRLGEFKEAKNLFDSDQINDAILAAIELRRVPAIVQERKQDIESIEITSLRL